MRLNRTWLSLFLLLGVFSFSPLVHANATTTWDEDITPTLGAGGVSYYLPMASGAGFGGVGTNKLAYITFYIGIADNVDRGGVFQLIDIYNNALDCHSITFTSLHNQLSVPLNVGTDSSLYDQNTIEMFGTQCDIGAYDGVRLVVAPSQGLNVYFGADTTTGEGWYEAYGDYPDQSLIGHLADFATTTTQESLGSCDISLSFSFSSCMALIFYPDWSKLTTVWNTAQSGFLSAVPWGYITLITSDLANTATSTLPSITVSTPPNFPITATLHEDIFSALPTASTSLFSTATTSTGATFRSTFEPYWNVVISLVFALAVMRLLLQSHGHKTSEKTV